MDEYECDMSGITLEDLTSVIELRLPFSEKYDYMNAMEILEDKYGKLSIAFNYIEEHLDICYSCRHLHGEEASLLSYPGYYSNDFTLEELELSNQDILDFIEKKK